MSISQEMLLPRPGMPRRVKVASATGPAEILWMRAVSTADPDSSLEGAASGSTASKGTTLICAPNSLDWALRAVRSRSS